MPRSLRLVSHRRSWFRATPAYFIVIRAVAAGVGIGLSAVLALHATRVVPYRVVRRKRTLHVPDTWPALDVLHLSDLHLRRSDRGLLAAQMEALSRLNRQPDLVCVTGDVCGRVDDAPLVANLLRVVRPRLGTFVILGNHEYGAGAPGRGPRSERLLAWMIGAIYGPALSSGPREGEAIASALTDLGLRVLRNEGVRLQDGPRSLWLAGVDDGWAGRADIARAMRGRHPNDGALILVHEPELAFPAVNHGADVVLAGHTHGGQVRLPLLGALFWHRLDPRLRSPAGLQSIGASQLHLSAGLGQLVPLRFGCPPELVELHCVPTSDVRCPLTNLDSGLPEKEA